MALVLNKKVSLGRLKPEYAINMYKWMCDPVVRDNIGLRKQPTYEQTVEWIEKAQKSIDILVLPIMLEDVYIGNIVIDKIDKYLSNARLSVYIGEKINRGIGIGTTAIYLAISNSFSELSLHKIWLIVHSLNFRAINLYIKLGFVIEGVLRDEFLYRGRRLSVFYMGLMRSEFDQIKIEEK